MACDYPIKAYYARKRNENGKRSLVFDPVKGSDESLEIACGRCMGCRLERARQWAIRCMHETQMHDANTYITLTYENEPEGGTLVPRDLQLFMKRLRKQRGPGIRFFACGEYGEKNDRPHYHSIIFGTDFEDIKFYKYNKAGQPLYTSATLEEIWQAGQCTIGAVTFESAAYVASYTTKKITGEKAPDHYMGRLPEFGRMSRRPGIGATWVQQYGKQTYEHDNVYIRGRLMQPPKYYDIKQTALDSDELNTVKENRRKQSNRRHITNLDKRRRQRQISTKVRNARMDLNRRHF